MKDTGFYVPQYAPSLTQQDLLIEQFINKDPTKLSDMERSVTSKAVQQEDEKKFELGIRERTDLPTSNIVGFQRAIRKNNQQLKIDSSNRPPVTLAPCNIASERYADAGKLQNLTQDIFGQSLIQILSCFRHLTKDDINQKQQQFITNNVNADSFNFVDIGCLFLFSIYSTKNLLLRLN